MDPDQSGYADASHCLSLGLKEDIYITSALDSGLCCLILHLNFQLHLRCLPFFSTASSVFLVLSFDPGGQRSFIIIPFFFEIFSAIPLLADRRNET